MRHTIRGTARPGRLLALAVSATALVACSDGQPLDAASPETSIPASAIAALDCVVSVESGMRCAPATPGTGPALGVQIGGQNQYLRLSSTNAGYDSGTGIFSMDVTLQNLLPEAIGTADGVTPDPNGIMVFFAVDPYATTGAGSVDVNNETGNAYFTGASQAYFTYNEVLEQNEVSAPMRWEFAKPAGVTAFSFRVFVDTPVEPLLVINEVLANPANYNASPDVSGEWFEIYNAGTLPVEMEGLLIADSAASGRRPYHRIASPLTIQPGGYVVLGTSASTASNGGVAVDYAYGNALALANSLDALKIAKESVVPGDTVTIDRTQYSNPAVSAMDGVSRELLNPALDNSNMDASNWGNASVTAVYGVGGRGTPGAQNSTFVP